MRDKPLDVVLYGFGRIGRLLARLLIERMGGGERFRLRASSRDLVDQRSRQACRLAQT